MYMSKNWMTNVWSWDHCFNAMALCRDHPSLAWDQWMIMADFQDGYCEEFDAAIEHAGLTLTGASFRVECCFAENYDALTGEGLRDRAYTWTASTAMILVREILSMNR